MLMQLDKLIHALILANHGVVDDVASLIINAEECVGVNALAQTVGNNDVENVMVDDDIDVQHPVKSLLGTGTIKDTEYHGVLMASDWQLPYLGVLYVENNQLQLYIPQRGNALNPISNQPFGDDEDHDNAVARHLGYNEYADIDLNDPLQLQQFFDINAIKNDISAI